VGSRPQSASSSNLSGRTSSSFPFNRFCARRRRRNVESCGTLSDSIAISSLPHSPRTPCLRPCFSLAGLLITLCQKSRPSPSQIGNRDFPEECQFFHRVTKCLDNPEGWGILADIRIWIRGPTSQTREWGSYSISRRINTPCSLRRTPDCVRSRRLQGEPSREIPSLPTRSCGGFALLLLLHVSQCCGG